MLAGCTSGGAERSAPEKPATPTPQASPTVTTPTADPVIRKVPLKQWRRMVAAGMWRQGCPIGRDQLRRVEINHVDFDGRVRRGVLVVNADIAASTVRIFTQLFEAGFPIRQMRSLEAYDGDSNASLRDDNTAAYNCRRLDQINAPPMESPHANGRAIDINPVENPWMDLRCKCWSPGPKYKARRPGPGIITKGGVVWKAFISEGWVWQNIKVPDYMHFDTGYPSRPFRDKVPTPSGTPSPTSTSTPTPTPTGGGS